MTVSDAQKAYEYRDLYVEAEARAVAAEQRATAAEAELAEVRRQLADVDEALTDLQDRVNGHLPLAKVRG